MGILQDEWRRWGSPYNIKDEYRHSLICNHFRSRLRIIGFSDENIISSFLKKKQKQYLEIIKTKVPEDDLVLDILAFDYEFGPSLAMNTRNADLDRQIRKYFNMFFDKKSRIKRLEEVEKYETLKLIQP